MILALRNWLTRPFMRLVSPQNGGAAENYSKYKFSATFIAVNCDETSDECAERARDRWPNINHHTWIDTKIIKLLKVRYVPNRMIVDVKSRKLLMWWDGEFGRVLHGPWASSVKNPSKGILWECAVRSKKQSSSKRRNPKRK